MNQLIIDTSAYSAFRRGDIVVEPYFTSTHEILVPTIVLGELRAGFCSSRYQVENERLLQKFLVLVKITVKKILYTTLFYKVISKTFVHN